MVLRLSNILQQFREISVAVGNDVYLIVLERKGHALVDEQVHQLAMALRHTEVFLLHKVQHGALGELVQRALADQSLPAVVDAEEEIENDADNRYEEDDQRPRHRLGGLPVVHDDMNDSYCYHYPR